jgi:hypothetical protein
MERRRFIQATTALVLLPAGAGLAGVARPDYVFFDERFQQARGAVVAWPAAKQLIAVHSDITAVWGGGLDRMIRGGPLRVCGVTTESFLFCLRVLAGEHANLDVRVSRLDRNLLQWTMNTQPILIAGGLHG